MSFESTDSYIQAIDIRKRECRIEVEHILEINAFTIDLGTEDERRISIETTHGITYQFSEEENNWLQLLKWLRDLAQLQRNWVEKAYPEPFSQNQTTLWRLDK
jgi:hypothetical protein